VAPPINRAQSAVARVQGSRLGHFLAKYGRDQADNHAALIAFSALFSLFPLVGALLTLLGLLIRDGEKLQELVETINKLFPAQLTDLLGFLQETRQITGLLGVVSFFGLLWSGSALFGSMALAFNSFYGLKDRGFIGQRLMAFVMIFVFLALIMVSVVASGSATFLLGFPAESLPIAVPGLGLLQSLAGWGLSVASAFLMFLAIYRIVPNGPMNFGGIWKGALLAAVLFALINQLFPIYLRFFGGSFQAYKTLGLFLLLMTWFYLMARILVLGCELNAFLNPLPASAQTAPEPQPVTGQTTESQADRRPGFGRRLLRFGALAGLALLIMQRSRRKA
jgi:membrane protein